MEKNMNNAVVVNFAIENNTITEEQLRELANRMGFSLCKKSNKKAKKNLITTLKKNGITYDPDIKFPACKTGYVNTNVFEYLMEQKGDGHSMRVYNTIRVLNHAEMHKEGRGLKMSIVQTVYDLCKEGQMTPKQIETVASEIKIATADVRGLVNYYHQFVADRMKENTPKIKVTKRVG